MSSPATDRADLGELTRQLADCEAQTSSDAFPTAAWRAVAQAGVCAWFVPSSFGGVGWAEEQLCDGYVALARGSLTTTFLLTQWAAAVRRIAASGNVDLQRAWLPPLARGERFVTVGISHLTTSRRHLARPVLSAAPAADGWRLSGFSPWVTGAHAADAMVVGAMTEDGEQLLALIARDAPGVEVGPAADLVALSASDTCQVTFHDVFVPASAILDGPVGNVLAKSGGAGGLTTSALALGLASAASDYLQAQAIVRPALAEPVRTLQAELADQLSDLRAAARSSAADVPATEALRARANAFVLRATQAALLAAKGAGFVRGHPVGRWCEEALFFLVWSCPQAVVDANLASLCGEES